jgi:hypothetical protein
VPYVVLTAGITNQFLYNLTTLTATIEIIALTICDYYAQTVTRKQKIGEPEKDQIGKIPQCLFLLHLMSLRRWNHSAKNVKRKSAEVQNSVSIVLAFFPNPKSSGLRSMN